MIKLVINPIGFNNVDYSVETANHWIYICKRLVDEWKLTELQERYVMYLSNGQSRHVRLARAFLKMPALVLIDDPFLGLDPTTSSIIYLPF